MKVRELFESIVTEKVAPPVSNVFPKSFISKVYKQFTLDAHELPEIMKSKPSLSMILKGVVLSVGKDGEFYAIGYSSFQYSKGGKPVVLSTNDKTIFDKTFADAIKSFGAGEYYFIKYSDRWNPTRGNHNAEIARDRSDGKAQDILQDMNDTFLPGLKKKVEGYLDDIFKNMRKLPAGKQGGWSWDKSEREMAVAAAESLEKLVKDGFNRATMEDWLRANNAAAYGSWGSIPTNYRNFVELMAETPNAKAKFANTVFSRAKRLHDDIMERVKNAEAKK
jgi:hypothetical protein